MNGIMAWLAGLGKRRGQALAHELAQKCCPAVWRKVQQQANSMSLAEARGYIQAHASEVLEHEAVALSGRHKGLTKADLGRLQHQAKQILLEALVKEIVRVQRTAAPRRIAA